MLSAKMEEALNAQINAEGFSAYLYLSMSAYAESLNMSGFANWFRIQSQEEQFHMMKIFDYVAERGGRVRLEKIETPQVEWDSLLKAFEDTLEHEKYISDRINKLVDLAIQESDHATNAFLQWFVTEQVEEESTADGILQKLRLMKDAPGALFMMDQELGRRAYTPPPAA